MSYQLANLAPVRFDYLDGIGSGGCTDIDVMIERHGYFLVVENKHPDEEIPLGQLITLRALAALPQFTVFVVRGFPPDTILSYGILDSVQVGVDRDGFREYVQAWWDAH